MTTTGMGVLMRRLTKVFVSVLPAVLCWGLLGVPAPLQAAVRFDPDYQHENGVWFAAKNRIKEPTYDHRAESKQYAAEFLNSKIYKRLPFLLREKLTDNQENYFAARKDAIHPRIGQKNIFVYMDNNINIDFQYDPLNSYEAVLIDLEKYPESLKGLVMATYIPSPALDARTRRPYFEVPEDTLKSLPESERAYFKAFLSVMNENFHFLTAYPLLRVDPVLHAAGYYYGKVVPGQYLAPYHRIAKEARTARGLVATLKERLGTPLYDFSDIDCVKYNPSYCSSWNPTSDDPDLGAFAFLGYREDETDLEWLQYKVSKYQIEIMYSSVAGLKKALEAEYQARRSTLSPAADALYRRLQETIVGKIDTLMDKWLAVMDKLPKVESLYPEFLHREIPPLLMPKETYGRVTAKTQQTIPAKTSGLVMATYTPSPAVDSRTHRSYLQVPNHIMSQLTKDDRDYFKAFLSVVNENIHFLTAYPLLRVDPALHAAGYYYGKMIPAQYLVPFSRIGDRSDGQDALTVALEERLGTPLYDFADATGVEYSASAWGPSKDDPDLSPSVLVVHSREAENPEWLQEKISRHQAEVLHRSLAKFRKNLDAEYQARKATFSKKADYLYRKLQGMIVQHLSAFERRLPPPQAKGYVFHRLLMPEEHLGDVTPETQQTIQVQ